MSVKLINIIDPVTGKTTHANKMPDGLWQTPDGIVLKNSEIKSDSGDGGILAFGVLFVFGLLVYQIIKFLV